ncbi:Rhodanese domain protein [Pseudopedobacter saltans DSM 12145]|uniref:Rhodanese domain protein n=1 Tax=Pseudopedobacter saltans (strain ATCC 51119 / DSM 12145 / JCM 21818 / CCUG 39354 / LMG 10337 / NBRC 100064 / NCIMB 13643) TaxID=762903 RepID=F0SBK2_PSESL|nr:rhodanese-like domain-containing protein [Pseudopedobacter saltans]ADY51648.1 Rhodanese domain protein [Pseudopedobacter saltans DSM 12145]
MEDIQSEEFSNILQTNKQDTFILDVREELEFHTFNVGGTNIPLGKMQKLLEDDDLEIPEDKVIIVVCQRGIRSKTAKTLLNNFGFKNVRNLEGGLLKLQRIL